MNQEVTRDIFGFTLSACTGKKWVTTSTYTHVRLNNLIWKEVLTLRRSTLMDLCFAIFSAKFFTFSSIPSAIFKNGLVIAPCCTWEKMDIKFTPPPVFQSDKPAPMRSLAHVHSTVLNLSSNQLQTVYLCIPNWKRLWREFALVVHYDICWPIDLRIPKHLNDQLLTKISMKTKISTPLFHFQPGNQHAANFLALLVLIIMCNS